MNNYSMQFGNGRVAIVAMLLFAAACEPVTEPQTAQVAAAAQSVHAVTGGRLFFNPQPEPPAKLDFSVSGQIHGLLRGEYRLGDSGGLLEIETLSSIRRGAVLHLTQRWTVHPPEPVLPSDPVHPQEPVQPVALVLQGVFHPGRLVLNGSGPAGGRAHVKAEVNSSSSGLSTAMGALMFNPQPEPPAER